LDQLERARHFALRQMPENEFRARSPLQRRAAGPCLLRDGCRGFEQATGSQPFKLKPGSARQHNDLRLDAFSPS
jgi:hypothetical protein